jgi:hypothetical protein
METLMTREELTQAMKTVLTVYVRVPVNKSASKWFSVRKNEVHNMLIEAGAPSTFTAKVVDNTLYLGGQL